MTCVHLPTFSKRYLRNTNLYVTILTWIPIWISGALWIFVPEAVAEFQLMHKAAVVQSAHEVLEGCQQKKEKVICEAEFTAAIGKKLGEWFLFPSEIDELLKPVESVWVIFGRLALWVLSIPLVLLLFYSVIAWVVGGFRVARERGA